MSIEVSKVTAFITREAAGERQLLVFNHPRTGVQLPAGTAEQDETPEAALLREVREQTGLTAIAIAAPLDTVELTLEGKDRVLTAPYALEIEPGDTGRRVAALKLGAPVQIIGFEGNYTRVWYNFKLEDGSLRPDLRYTGWLPGDLLTEQTRHFLFQVKLTAPATARWSHEVARQVVECYWANLDVELIAPQQQWLDRVRDRLQF